MANYMVAIVSRNSIDGGVAQIILDIDELFVIVQEDI